MSLDQQIQGIEAEGTRQATGTRPQRPLLMAIRPVLQRVQAFKDKAKSFYFEVILSQYRCPACSGPLAMTGVSQVTCRHCGQVLDPTLTFQRSSCCEAALVRRQLHYSCAQCGQVVPSRFLFDELLFDSEYFREMMAAHRQRQKERREEAAQRLAASRSGELVYAEAPDLESLPGLLGDLDNFMGQLGTSEDPWDKDLPQAFDLQRYRAHLWDQLGWSRRSFSSFSALSDSGRRDRACRFVTLIFMEQDKEVALAQNGPSDLWVERATP